MENGRGTGRSPHAHRRPRRRALAAGRRDRRRRGRSRSGDRRAGAAAHPRRSSSPRTSRAPGPSATGELSTATSTRTRAPRCRSRASSRSNAATRTSRPPAAPALARRPRSAPGASPFRWRFGHGSSARSSERFVLTTTGPAASPAVVWNAPAEFPGLLAGEQLRRVDSAPARGQLLARDGSPLGELASASNVIGAVGEASGALLEQTVAAGFPASTPVGLDGLEAVFQSRARRPPRRVAVRRRAAAGERRGAAGTRRAHVDLAAAPDAGGERARHEPRRDRRDGAGHRRGAGGGGRAAVGAPAARLDLQDHHADRPCSRRTSATRRASTTTRPRPRSTVSSCTTPTARTAAARSRTPSRSPATRSSRRSGCGSVPAISSTPPTPTASTRPRRSRSPPRARCRRPA